MNTKLIGVSSKIKQKNEKQNNSKDFNHISKRPLNNISIVLKYPSHYQYRTTKHSPEIRDVSGNKMKNIKQSHIKVNKEINGDYLKIKKKNNDIASIIAYKNSRNNSRNASKEKQSSYVIKYIENLNRKTSLYPYTSNHTRKTSKDKTNNKLLNNEKSQNSYSINKIKRNYLINTKDLKDFPSQYSILSHISRDSNSKKKSTSKPKTESFNTNTTSKNNTFNYQTNNNNHNYNKKGGNIAINLSLSKNNNQCHDIKKKQLKKNQIITPHSIKKHPINSAQRTVIYNSILHKKLQYPKQSTYPPNNQPFLNTLNPSLLKSNKLGDVSNDINHHSHYIHNIRNIRTTSQLKPKNKTNNFMTQKNTIDDLIKHFADYRLYKPSFGYLTLSHSVSKTRKLKENHNNINHNSNLHLSSINTSIYYQNESKKISNYIRNYYSNHKHQYPQTTFQFYKIGRVFGHGAFGKVNISLHVLTGRIVAIKSFNKTKHLLSRKRIQYEIQLMKKLNSHRNIIKVYEEIESEKYHCIVMEYINGGNLLSLIHKRTKLSEDIARFIFIQLIDALKYIHSHDIVHRDIKPDNILIDLNNTIKICDFGIGREIKHGKMIRECCGTPAFTAPELYLDEPYDPFMSDIWSCGVVLYSMLTGVFPFRGNNDYELHQNIIEGKYSPINGISKDCTNLLKYILDVNPKTRITLQEMQTHPWMTSKKNTTKEKLNSIHLFTNAEKIIYYKLSIDYRKGKREELIEAFTLKNIDTEYENEIKNIKTRSIIITPPNSLFLNEDDEDLYYSDLRIENLTMKFLSNINDLNRKYEINFNAEADQGQIIHKRMNPMKRQMISLHNSFDNKNEIKSKDKNKAEGDSFILNLHDDLKKNDNIKNLKDYNVSTISHVHHIDDNILRQVEEFGYRKEYIIKSLEANDLNHASATYNILLHSIGEIAS